MMKGMDDGSDSIDNWLGFSLSSHLNMDVAAAAPQHDQHRQFVEHDSHVAVTSAAASLHTSFYIPCSSSSSSPSPHQLTSHGLCYGVHVAETGGFHPPLTVMPLKSDGSLCIMEALNRSQPVCEAMVPSSSPKLEDFLGGATRETMALSLDSIYYHNPTTEPEANNNNGSSTTTTTNNNNNNRQQQDQMHYYSGFPCHGMYQPPPLEGDAKVNQLGNHCDSQSQIPQVGSSSTSHHDDSVLSLKNLVALGQQQHMNSAGGDGMVNCGAVAGMRCGGDLQSLSLSMSPGSQSSSCITAQRQISPAAGNECFAMEESKKRVAAAKVGQKPTVHRKSIETFGQRTSQYRGVTRHRWTGRYEAHLWDNSCKKEGQTRKGRQVYLGGYDMEEKAARAYDLAALKYWGPATHINFSLENYREELEEMKNMTRQEYVAHLRRKSSGFSRGASIYRGVTRHHQHGRWQARIGRVAGNKDLYLGTFSTQEEAAEAYDIAAIKFRGLNAVTNFDITRYDVEKIMASNTLLAGELARRNKESEVKSICYDNNQSSQNNGEIVVHSENNRNCEKGSSVNNGNYRDITTFSMALQNLVGNGIESLGCSQQQQVVDESGKAGATAHLSNPSSLVTSLSSSREGSPDRNGTNTMFDKNSLASKFINPTAGVGSWFQSPQIRPAAAAISMAHLPVFAAWHDT